MSIVPVSMTSLQNLIEGEKFYRRNFHIVKQFVMPNENNSVGATYRFHIDGSERDNYATEASRIVMEGVSSSQIEEFENSLHEQRLNYSMILSTSKHVYTAYHSVS